jgi:hypothetical protein
MTLSTKIKVGLGLAVLVWTCLLPIYGIKPTFGLLAPYSTVVAIVTIFASAFDSLIWRAPFVRQYLAKRPWIGGVWKVQINSNWVDPEFGVSKGPILGFAYIRQTYGAIQISIFTEQSASTSISVLLKTCENDTFEIIATYSSVPRQSAREISEIHHGSMILRVVDGNIPAMEGAYWTDRQTVGEIFFKDRIKGKANTFDSAKTFYSAPRG